MIENRHLNDNTDDAQRAYRPRPTIHVVPDVPEIVNRAEDVLLRSPNVEVFQRGGSLVRVVRDPRESTEGKRTVPARIDTVASAWLRELLSIAARWIRLSDDGEVEILPPKWVIDGLVERKEWQFPHLDAIVTSPTLRPDGTVLTEPGYDTATSLLYEPSDAFPILPEEVSKDDAVAALECLLGPFKEFPFASETDRAAAVAGVLTLAARHAIDGPCPMFGVLAPVAGTGKSLFVEASTLIGTGRRPEIRSAKHRDEELEKVITTIAMEAQPAVCFDNAEGRFGSATLAAALTATEWSGRKLGFNRTITAPLRTTFFLTGNNVALNTDTYRRVVPVSLDAKVERPEDREFEQPNLIRHVREQRPTLLVAALTILRAFFCAGRPTHGDSRMGSFEAWDDLVRATVVWVMGIDPCANRARLRTQSDTDYEAARALFAAWRDAVPNGRAMTVRNLVDVADIHGALRDALAALDRRGDGSRINTRAIGYAFRRWAGRVIDGLCLDRADQTKEGVLWRVVPVHGDIDIGGDGVDSGDAAARRLPDWKPEGFNVDHL